MNKFSKKISIFCPALLGGGAERAMLKLAGGIASRGYPVDMVLARAEGPYLNEVPKSIRIVDLKARRVLTSLPALVRYLRSEQPTALLSVLHANIIAIWARRLANVPTRILVSERNTLSIEVQHYASDMRIRLSPMLSRYFYPDADCIIAVSKGVAKDLIKVIRIPNEYIRVIYNPIVTHELREKKKEALDHPWFEQNEPPVILAVGRLTLQKDFKTLIMAFSKVRKKHQIRLLILGEGKERQALETLAEQQGVKSDLKLPGFVSNPYPYMTRASLFVLSSRWEGLPGVLIEAMYCGTPIISTDCHSGPREILRDGKYGILVPVGDVDALAKAITNTLNVKLHHPPKKESWKAFKLEVVVNQYLDVLLGG